ncbi:hypothetical protein [uncultured Croceitalea sp.]|uniref:hypothetical protein n=1 Tax=uncultured Croceitalea sp. TaxID=1798908 RepID=UPI0033068C12
MKRVLLALFIITLGLVACTDRDDELTTANIRIKNNSAIAFNLVEVITDSLFYENIAADGFSEYIEYEEAFEAMPFTIEADSANYNFTPAQQGLEPLPVGLYTYEVTIDEAGEVVLSFKVD